MGYIIIDRDKEGEGMRSNMRNSMRGGGYMRTSTPMMRGDGWEHGYRMGYRHGWEDSEDDMEQDERYRRGRDSKGRYI